jgi:hypothetical protein
MTGPEFSGADTASIAAGYTMRPSNAPLDAPPLDYGPYGPDPDRTPPEDAIPFENLKTGNAKKPRGAAQQPRPGKSVFGTLGTNKKARSAVRRLVEADKEKIANLYVYGAMALMPLRPEAGQVMAASADACADAWYELAQENDTVRRALLAFIEGGVWGKVFMAHMPILAALVPQHVLPANLRNSNIGQMMLDMLSTKTPDAPPEEAAE